MQEFYESGTASQAPTYYVKSGTSSFDDDIQDDVQSESSSYEEDIETGPVTRKDSLESKALAELLNPKNCMLPLGRCPGAGGCVIAWLNLSETMKSGVAGLCSTTLTFGLRPLVQTAVASALGAAAAPALVTSLTSAIVSGIFVGLIHSTVSAAVSGIVNGFLATDTHPLEKDAGYWKKFAAEVGSVDAVVFANFVAAYATRGAIVEEHAVENVWNLVTATAGASIGAGFMSGAMTNVVQQALVRYTEVYGTKPAPDIKGKKLEFLKTTVKNVWVANGLEGFGKNIVGKMVGAATGMVAATYIGGANPTDIDASLMGGGAMAGFLTAWFLGIRGGQLAGHASDDIEMPSVSEIAQNTRILPG